MTTLQNYLTDHHEKMDLFTSAITRAHGKNHPEAFDIRDLYIEMMGNFESDDKLQTIFDELTSVTDNYAVPSDVCETYEAVIHHLKHADELYRHELTE